MTILILAAFSGELRGLLASAPSSPMASGLARERHRLRRFEGDEGGAWMAVLGVGAAASEAAISTILEALPEAPSLCVLTGCCGALREELGPGDLILPRTLKRGDAPDFEVDAARHAEASAVLGAALTSTEPLFTAEVLVGEGPAKRALSDRGAAVDMESHPCALRLRALGHEPLVLRAVVDRVDDRVPDIPPSFDEMGRPKILKSALSALIKPTEMPALIRLGRSFEKSQAAIAEGLRALIRAQVSGAFEGADGGGR